MPTNNSWRKRLRASAALAVRVLFVVWSIISADDPEQEIMNRAVSAVVSWAERRDVGKPDGSDKPDRKVPPRKARPRGNRKPRRFRVNIPQ